MNLDDYMVFPCPYADYFEVVYVPDSEVLLTTQRVSLTTLLRVATQHNLRRTK